jgi:phosphate transport system permease protein
LLAISRAIGETMIVVMAAGAATTVSNPFDSMTTVTFQISSGSDRRQGIRQSPDAVAFALGLVLLW